MAKSGLAHGEREVEAILRRSRDGGQSPTRKVEGSRSPDCYADLVAAI